MLHFAAYTQWFPIWNV